MPRDCTDDWVEGNPLCAPGYRVHYLPRLGVLRGETTLDSISYPCATWPHWIEVGDVAVSSAGSSAMLRIDTVLADDGLCEVRGRSITSLSEAWPFAIGPVEIELGAKPSSGLPAPKESREFAREYDFNLPPLFDSGGVRVAFLTPHLSLRVVVGMEVPPAGWLLIPDWANLWVTTEYTFTSGLEVSAEGAFERDTEVSAFEVLHLPRPSITVPITPIPIPLTATLDFNVGGALSLNGRVAASVDFRVSGRREARVEWVQGQDITLTGDGSPADPVFTFDLDEEAAAGGSLTFFVKPKVTLGIGQLGGPNFALRLAARARAEVDAVAAHWRAALEACVRATIGGELHFWGFQAETHRDFQEACLPVAGRSGCWDECNGVLPSRCELEREIHCGDADDGDNCWDTLETDCPQGCDEARGVCTEPEPLCHDLDGDGIPSDCSPFDCNDNNPDRSQLSDERCNGIDDDCDTLVDGDDPGFIRCPPGLVCGANGCENRAVPCDDSDGDSYGANCPAGTEDCAPNDGTVHPGAAEICNGHDDDCNGLSDLLDPAMRPCGAGTECAAGGCVAPPPPGCDDPDHDTFGPNCPAGANDCAPNDAAVNPGAVETCNGHDDNCDGQSDLQDPAMRPCGAGTACTAGGCVAPPPPGCDDPDGDTYGPNCPAGADDCMPNNGAIHPGAAEICNGIDDDCDNRTDLIDPGMQACPVGQACVSGHCAVQPAGCPGNCNGHGTCDAGVCVCGDCWSGAGCDVAAAPTATNAVCTSWRRGEQATCTLNGQCFVAGSTPYVEDMDVTSHSVLADTISLTGTWVCGAALGPKQAAYRNPDGQGVDWNAGLGPLVRGPVIIREWWAASGHTAPANAVGVSFGANGCNLDGLTVAYVQNVTTYGIHSPAPDQVLWSGDVDGNTAIDNGQVCLAVRPNPGPGDGACASGFDIQ